MDDVILNDKWIKASIIGTLWAASEIVLGSFLHNLKIPFSGNILTAIGLIILISVSYIWTEKGLFWRAGLICAIMKTMSPSAVIFGPMIAIFSEAALLEISVRFLGRTMAGYILGSMFAMSWNLFQKIANYIIFYGFNIVDLYTNLLKFAQKQLNIQSDIIWLPILFLLVIYSVFGMLSALAGIKVGRKIRSQPADKILVNNSDSYTQNQGGVKPEFKYSLVWLITDIALITGALVLLNSAQWYFWSTAIVTVVVIWGFRYKRAIRQLSKPKFWILFVLITMVTAFIFTRIMADSNSLGQGLLLGIQMNFRAVIIIVGFSVLGTELFNPVIRAFFLKTSFKQLPLALELSFESLPSMIAGIPDLKTILKNPVSILYIVISQVDSRLAEIRSRVDIFQNVFIITGSVGQGKTTMVQKIIENLKASGISVGGICSPRIMLDNETIGYDIVDIGKNEREQFLRQTDDDNLKQIGRFSICAQGLQKGREALKSAVEEKNRIIVVDEAGNFELEDHGWSQSIRNLVDASDSHILMVVRDVFVDKIILEFDLKQSFVFNVTASDPETISRLIISKINSRGVYEN